MSGPAPSIGGDAREQAERNRAARERLDRATAALEPPFAVIDLDAFDENAADLLRRAAGKPLRLATKSVRCRVLQDRALDAGFRGQLCFTLPEALWLAGHGATDLVVAYPTADRAALRELADGPHADAITVMVDDVAHLDLIAAAAADGGAPVRVAIDVDAGWRALRDRLRIGAKRSPVRSPEDAAALAREIVARGGARLAGIMCYEAQIAGVGDDPPAPAMVGAAIRWMQAASARELASRRAKVVDAVRAVAPLEFVNGGGTGSVHATAAEPAVTEVAAGSGLFGPTLFDTYSAFSPRPAALFALPVVRRPSSSVATVLGGGYPASGPSGADRLPRPSLPPGLRLTRAEGAGEVQTPLLGPPAAGLQIGDRVWFRHAKAGELCERFATLHLVAGDRVVDAAPTYRGEGQTFL
jgi:D-serine deaminase-like pyridoxal phosphate-dependent protein